MIPAKESKKWRIINCWKWGFIYNYLVKKVWHNFDWDLSPPRFMRWHKSLLHIYLGNSTTSVCTVRVILWWMNASRTFLSSICTLEEKNLSLFSASEILAKYFNNLEQQILEHRSGLSPQWKQSFSLFFYWPWNNLYKVFCLFLHDRRGVENMYILSFFLSY